MNKSYRILFPEYKSDFETEWSHCLTKLREQHEGLRCFKLVIFISAAHEAEYRERCHLLKLSLKAFFGDGCPAFTILAQAPGAFQVAVEAGYLKESDVHVSYQSFRDIPYVVLEGFGYREIWGCGMQGDPPSGSVEKDSALAFDQMLDVLKREGMEMDHVVRQWNYIGEILKVEEKNSRKVQNYQVFNEVRNQYYQRYRHRKDFPSATGIGVTFPGVSIDFCALEEASEVVESVAVDNEKQQNPYAYGQEVLVGAPLVEAVPKQPPQFERARLLHSPDSSTLFLSGTASIIGQETVGVNDVVKQTHVTIDHLQTLAEIANVKKYTSRVMRDAGKWRLLRAYVRNKEDFSVVKKICSERFPDVPAVFVQADVCRDNLLVEIEGEMGF